MLTKLSAVPGADNDMGDEYDDLLDSVLPKRRIARQPTANTSTKGPWAGASASVDAPRYVARAGVKGNDPYDALIDSVLKPRMKRTPLQPAGMGDVQEASRVHDPLVTSRADVERPLYESQAGQFSRVPQSSDELRVMKGEQPLDRQAYQHQEDIQGRLEAAPSEVRLPPLPPRVLPPNSMQARKRGLIERAAETIKDYAPGIRSIDTPMGIKSDLPRGIARGLTLGAVGDVREITPEERLINPNAETERDVAGFVGETAAGFVPYVGAGKIASAIPALNRATRGSRILRDASLFGGVGAAREGITSAKTGEDFNLANVAIDTAIGAATGGIAGVDPGFKRQIAAFIAPSVVAGVARGESPEQLAQTAVTNLLFGLHSGGGKKPLTAERIGELRARIEGERPAKLAAEPLPVESAPQEQSTLSPTLDRRQTLETKAISPLVEQRVGERRTDPAQRLKVSEMTDAERQTALLTSDVVDLPNKRAYGEAPKKAVQVRSDVDGLSWVNDNLGHEAGNALLKAKAQALKEEGVDSYHFSGDEFSHQFDTHAEATAKMDAVADRLSKATIKITTPDGVVHEYTGAQFSKGIGANEQQAESGLKQNKDARRESGERAAVKGGQPPRLVETTASPREIAEGQQARSNTPAEVTPTLKSEPSVLSRETARIPVSKGKEVIPSEPGAVSEGDAAPIKRTRAFQKSAERAGLPQGTDLTYAVNTDVGAVSRANERIKSDGHEKVARELLTTQEHSKDDIVTASIIAHEMTAKGDLKGAIDLVDDMARKLTNAGQTAQAASLIARLSPEGVLLAGQRRVPRGTKLSEEQGTKLVEQASKVKEAEAKIASLEQELLKIKGDSGTAPLTRKAARERIGTLEDRLVKAEQEARARLKERAAQAKTGGSELGASGIPLDIADYAIIGAAKIARKGITLAKWTDEMVKEFGESIRPQAKSIYRESYKLYDDQRKQFSQESQVRSARRAEPDSKDVQAVINKRALARKDAKTARAEMARLFHDLSLTKAGKVKAGAVDVLNVPRTLKSSVDLSAPRQGAMWMINHPVRGAKLFFGKQLKAMRQVNYDRFVDQLESDADYPLMVRSGLALTTTDIRPHSLSGREEAFMSRIAAKIPGVSHSERAYSTFLDTARSSWFKQLKNQAESKAKSEGKELTTEQYQAVANFVNIATGRGNLGKGWLNNSAPFLNAVFFAPKFAASKVQIFDPRVYKRLPPGARRTAMREAATYFGAMATAAMLLKYGLGAEVGTDPEESEFMKLKIGNTRYDLSNGTGQYMVLTSRLLRNAENKRTGEKEKFGHSLGDNLDRFTRYKFSPPAAFTRNVWEGKNAIGEETSAKREALELVAPLFLKDLYDAFEDEGLTGLAKHAPGFVGVGVNTYERKPPKERVARKDKRTQPQF